MEYTLIDVAHRIVIVVGCCWCSVTVCVAVLFCCCFERESLKIHVNYTITQNLLYRFWGEQGIVPYNTCNQHVTMLLLMMVMVNLICCCCWIYKSDMAYGKELQRNFYWIHHYMDSLGNDVYWSECFEINRRKCLYIRLIVAISICVICFSIQLRKWNLQGCGIKRDYTIHVACFHLRNYYFSCLKHITVSWSITITSYIEELNVFASPQNRLILTKYGPAFLSRTNSSSPGPFSAKH